MLKNGIILRKVFDEICPFTENGELLSKEERITLLASNANKPMEIQGLAFVMASAVGQHSPQIIQMSHSCCKIMGNDPKKISLIDETGKITTSNYCADGVRTGSLLLDAYTEQFGTELVFLALDHFTSPTLEQGINSGTKGNEDQKNKAKKKIENVIEFTGKQLEEEEINRFADYMVSKKYLQFREDFVESVKVGKAAWAMVDSGVLPPLLNFAVTKEIVDDVREFDESVMIEAEFNATGSSGDEEKYEFLQEKELEKFADEIVSFVKYTKTDGIAYEIGMKHAAKQDEKHEPDIKKLELTQRKLFQELGRYIPFAQHGGTGAAELETGLVGKNNINTKYLVNGAQFLLEHCKKEEKGILTGEKKSCGVDIYTRMTAEEAKTCLEKIKETNSYGLEPKILGKI